MPPSTSPVRWAWTLALVGVTGCGGAAANHETLGDRQYQSRQFNDALVEYRLAVKQRPGTARLHAKAGAAALRVGDLMAAAAEYVALAAASSVRRGEAADGLERVARAAMAADDRPALSAALAGLRQIAAGRALGSFAGQLARGMADPANASEAIVVLPYAAAAAPDARSQDSLVLLYARALARSARCEEGSSAFEGLIRRQRDPQLVAAAEQGLLQCAVGLGRAAMEQGSPAVAEEWFRRAALEAGDSPLGRAAYLGLGDVMMARGDYGDAAEAYQRAVTNAPPGDSVAEVARQRLGSISNAGTGVP